MLQEVTNGSFSHGRKWKRVTSRKFEAKVYNGPVCHGVIF